MAHVDFYAPPVSDVDSAAAGLTLDELFALADQAPDVPSSEYSEVHASIVGEFGRVGALFTDQADAHASGPVEDLPSSVHESLALPELFRYEEF